jgi:mevalonate kinase
MDYENSRREKLGRLVVPARVKKVFGSIRRIGGHPKVCGAGGGGCFVVWCEPELRDDVAALVGKHGMSVLDFRICRSSGLKEK